MSNWAEWITYYMKLFLCFFFLNLNIICGIQYTIFTLKLSGMWHVCVAIWEAIMAISLFLCPAAWVRIMIFFRVIAFYNSSHILYRGTKPCFNGVVVHSGISKDKSIASVDKHWCHIMIIYKNLVSCNSLFVLFRHLRGEPRSGSIMNESYRTDQL